MMLDIKKEVLYINFSYYFIISGSILIILGGTFLYLLNKTLISLPKTLVSVSYVNWFQINYESSSVVLLGTYLYSFFSFCFLMAGLLLLIAMIGGIVLTIPLHRNFIHKRQFLFYQVNLSPKSAMFLLNLKK